MSLFPSAAGAGTVQKFAARRRDEPLRCSIVRTTTPGAVLTLYSLTQTTHRGRTTPQAGHACPEWTLSHDIVRCV